MIKTLIGISFFYLTICSSFISCAQSENADNQMEYYFAVSVGPFNVMNDNATAGYLSGLSLNLAGNKFSYSIGYERFQEFSILSFRPRPREYYNSINLIIGRCIAEKRGKPYEAQVELLGGLSSFWGIRRTDSASSLPFSDYNTKNFSAIGLTGGFGFKIIFNDHLGMGGNIRAHLNKELVLLMAGISLNLGKTR